MQIIEQIKSKVVSKLMIGGPYAKFDVCFLGKKEIPNFVRETGWDEKYGIPVLGNEREIEGCIKEGEFYITIMHFKLRVLSVEIDSCLEIA